ncbi:hypothetical protein HWV62_17422 [Athelia sp. TMB]|nr:hypothetical protein HWV62_17422 [Athelia sp. TMB]
MSSQKVVIMGAGVIGLTTAYILASEPGLQKYDITIVARDMPEDMDSQAWASPWAGANWSPMDMGGKDVRIKRPLLYLPFLKSELESLGVRFVRKRLRSIEDVADMAGYDGIIVNALGIGARSLVGVLDTSVFPIRGQIILVQAPHCTDYYSDTTTYEEDGAFYIIPRPGPNGTILIGGTFQEHNWDTSHNEQTAKEIFARCAKVEPKLLDKDNVKILSHNVGLRPARESGPRVEIETISVPLVGELVSRFEDKPIQQQALRVVHAYGFG